MRETKRRAIIVLGMHRGGTSALTGALGMLGMRLPDSLMPPTTDNPKGYFESVQIYAIHERLLAAAGTSWSGIEGLPADWFHSAQASAYVDELVAAVRSDYGDAATFVVKDPRMCRLMPLWRKVLDAVGAQARFAIPLRNPLEVARSLEKRDGLSLAHGCLLWLNHVFEAERETRGLPRVFVHYRDLLSDPTRVAALIASQLTQETVTPDEENERDISSLIDPKLRHYIAEPEDLHHPEAFYPWLWEAYGAFGALMDHPAAKEPQRRLDRVRTVFDQAAASFVPLLVARDKTLAERDRKISALDQALAMRDARVVALDQALTEHKAKDVALNQTLAERDRELGGLRNALAEWEQKIVILDQALAEQKTKVVALVQALDERDRELGGLRNALSERDTQIGSLNHALAECDRQIIRLSGSISEIYASHSWQITKPLRWCGRQKRRVTTLLRLGSVPRTD